MLVFDQLKSAPAGSTITSCDDHDFVQVWTKKENGDWLYSNNHGRTAYWTNDALESMVRSKENPHEFIRGFVFKTNKPSVLEQINSASIGSYFRYSSLVGNTVRYNKINYNVWQRTSPSAAMDVGKTLWTDQELANIVTSTTDKCRFKSQYTLFHEKEEDPLEAFKRQVREVATRYAKKYGWCGEIENALAELGIAKEWKVGDFITHEEIEQLPVGSSVRSKNENHLLFRVAYGNSPLKSTFSDVVPHSYAGYIIVSINQTT